MTQKSNNTDGFNAKIKTTHENKKTPELHCIDYHYQICILYKMEEEKVEETKHFDKSLILPCPPNYLYLENNESKLQTLTLGKNPAFKNP